MSYELKDYLLEVEAMVEDSRKLKQLQSELDECNQSCDIITQTYFGKEEPKHVKESYAKFSLRSIGIQKEMKLIIEGL